MGQARSRAPAAGPYCWQPFPAHPPRPTPLGRKTHHAGPRRLGALYPYRFEGNGFLEGGGTIPWLGLVNRGLYDVDYPAWGGWSGRFTAEKQKNVWSRHQSVRQDEEQYGDFFCYTEDRDEWTNPEDGVSYTNEFAPVWRWRQAMLNNCQARFDWCVQPFAEANHHPVAAVDGDLSDQILIRQVSEMTDVTLDASASSDPDGDVLSYFWYFYPEASRHSNDLPTLRGERTSRCSFDLPDGTAGTQLHLVLEVKDNSDTVSLTDYRRVVFDVGP